ncbi:hypothetical protein [Halomonas urumqiensis]|uniref:DNA-binding protein n=1 Tax=Halomonas urumqiensis TaxID=1684789 RepID=A0A2N7UCN6_9GAMM|nr:hypothetical protein [Halomonas urumqiensis]PMR78145.1 hypothetical protein C1H70_15325 [Halomonas urumqiensis]PTB03294.1 hypothetical protein C6V82_01960 [Halomonas urumqiensis]GHE20544.1 hypothetical protein GCM10017767_10650 [Halomonas urumqiensis]
MEDVTHQEPIVISTESLIDRIRSRHPNALAHIPEKRAVMLVRITLQALAEEINAVDEGRLRVPGLGRVTIRQVERENDGETNVIKRVILSPTKSKEQA